MTVPPEVSTRQRLAAASHRAPVTSVPNRMRRLTSVRSATARRYSSISGWGAKVRVHSGLGARRQGVEERGHVALAAGVGVDVPGAPDVVLPLEDDDVVEAPRPAGGWPGRRPRSRPR